MLPLCALSVALAPGVAWAHGELESSDPEEGARLAVTPAKVTVMLTVAPSDARLRVRDGCGLEVAKKTNVTRRRAGTKIARSAQPGKWTVRFQVVSSEDGHITDEAFSFAVRGRRNCGTEEAEPPSPSPSASSAANDDSVARDVDEQPPSDQEGDAGLPALGIVLGAGVLVVAGLGLRRLLSR